MKYPRVINFIEYKKISHTTYEIYNTLSEEKYILSDRETYFLKKLNGKTDPHTILPDADSYEINELLDFFDESFLTVNSNLLILGGGSLIYTLGKPKITPFFKLFSKICHCILSVLWLPGFIISMIFFMNDVDFNAFAMIPGLLLSSVLHEFAHTFTTISFGGTVSEYGLALHKLIPGAYVLISPKTVLNKRQQCKVNSAGVKMNFLLSGVLFLAGFKFYFLSEIFYAFAFISLLSGFLNCALIDGVDGNNVISYLFGTESITTYAEKILRSSEKKNFLKNNGPSGVITLFFCYIIIALKAFLPILVIAGLTEGILWIILIKLELTM